MRKIAEHLSFFFIVITVYRVAFYIADALHVGFMGWPFSLGIAGGVYVSMYYTGFNETTQKAAKDAARMFLAVDLIFNEFELIRDLSASQLITPNSNFLGIGPVWLRYGMQITALLFGAIPTLGVAYLGRLQASVDEAWKGKLTAWQRITKAVAGLFQNVTGVIAVRIEVAALRLLPDAPPQSTNLTTVDGQVTEQKWGELSAEDIAYISANGRKAIQRQLGVSNGTAGNWKSRIKKGDRPWPSIKELPKIG